MRYARPRYDDVQEYVPAMGSDSEPQRENGQQKIIWHASSWKVLHPKGHETFVILDIIIANPYSSTEAQAGRLLVIPDSIQLNTHLTLPPFSSNGALPRKDHQKVSLKSDKYHSLLNPQDYFSQIFFNESAAKVTIPDRHFRSEPPDGLIHKLEMNLKPPRLRQRQATSEQQQPSGSGPKFGPLSVSALAGLIAAAFALFVLGTWLVVILIRRRRSRRRRTGTIRGRQKDRLPDEKADREQKITDTAEGVERHSLNRNIKSSNRYMPAEQAGDEFKFDPWVSFLFSTLQLYDG
jgi:hypothetical protein